MPDLNGKRILVTGGSGAFGRHFIRRVLNFFPQVEELVVFSRDELKHFRMATELPSSKIRYVVGNVRDAARLRRACTGVDIVVHAAAMKQVPVAEANPLECIQTNILGAANVIEAALDAGVERLVAISTDKAAAPNNLYGATKLCADKLFAAAQLQAPGSKTIFSSVRYGNVLGAPASVVPFFLEQRKTGVLPLTHGEMTRFHITPDAAVDMVMHALEHAEGGEVFVPKLPAFHLKDLAQAIGPDCEHRITEIRPGEKLNEDLITPGDALKTLEFENHFVICPSVPLWDEQTYAARRGGKPVPEDFHYASDNCGVYLTVEELREQIREFVDPEFGV